VDPGLAIRTLCDPDVVETPQPAKVHPSPGSTDSRQPAELAQGHPVIAALGPHDLEDPRRVRRKVVDIGPSNMREQPHGDAHVLGGGLHETNIVVTGDTHMHFPLVLMEQCMGTDQGEELRVVAPVANPASVFVGHVELAWNHHPHRVEETVGILVELPQGVVTLVAFEHFGRSRLPLRLPDPSRLNRRLVHCEHEAPVLEFGVEVGARGGGDERDRAVHTVLPG